MNEGRVIATANGGNWLVATHARLKDFPDWQIQEAACGHQIMLDHPDELVLLLSAEAAR